jgi:antitoxin component of MazEF toxin-antitoxin module
MRFCKAMIELKVRKFGNSLGIVLPKEVINRLHTGDGEPLFLIERSDGSCQLTPYNPAFEEKMAKADEVIQSIPQYLARPRQVKNITWIEHR